MIRVITIPNGRQVTLGQYVTHWKQLLTLPPSEPVKGWNWFCETAGEVLRDISYGVQDRINTRGNLQIRNMSESRLWKLKEKHLISECRWCGQSLGRYAPEQHRFCEASCRKAFYE